MNDERVKWISPEVEDLSIKSETLGTGQDTYDLDMESNRNLS